MDSCFRRNDREKGGYMNRFFKLGLVCIAAVFAGMAAAGMVSHEVFYAVPFLPVLGAALTADRNTPMRDGKVVSLPVAASKKIYAGSLVARDANGYATPGATATTVLGVGRAETQADNSSGSDGGVSVDVRKGVFRFANSTGGDEVTGADIGSDCYIVDDQTVAKTDGTGTRSAAGKVFDVDSDGVWVRFD